MQSFWMHLGSRLQLPGILSSSGDPGSNQQFFRGWVQIPVAQEQPGIYKRVAGMELQPLSRSRGTPVTAIVGHPEEAFFQSSHRSVGSGRNHSPTSRLYPIGHGAPLARRSLVGPFGVLPSGHMGRKGHYAPWMQDTAAVLFRRSGSKCDSIHLMI